MACQPSLFPAVIREFHNAWFLEMEIDTRSFLKTSLLPPFGHPVIKSGVKSMALRYCRVTITGYALGSARSLPVLMNIHLECVEETDLAFPLTRPSLRH